MTINDKNYISCCALFYFYNALISKRFISIFYGNLIITIFISSNWMKLHPIIREMRIELPYPYYIILEFVYV